MVHSLYTGDDVLYGLAARVWQYHNGGVNKFPTVISSGAASKGKANETVRFTPGM